MQKAQCLVVDDGSSGGGRVVVPFFDGGFEPRRAQTFSKHQTKDANAGQYKGDI